MKTFQLIVVTPNVAVVAAEDIQAAGEIAKAIRDEFQAAPAPNEEFDPVQPFVHSVVEIKTDVRLRPGPSEGPVAPSDPDSNRRTQPFFDPWFDGGGPRAA